MAPGGTLLHLICGVHLPRVPNCGIAGEPQGVPMSVFPNGGECVDGTLGIAQFLHDMRKHVGRRASPTPGLMPPLES